MIRAYVNALLTFYIISIFVLSAVRTLSELKISENPNYFFFSKFWFYSLVVYVESILAQRFSRILVLSVIFPFFIFAISTELDQILFFKSFDKGLSMSGFVASITSFFVLGGGIPKVSLILLFSTKFIFLLFLVITRRVSILYALIFFSVAYILWNVSHIYYLYGRIKIFDVILFENIDISYVLSGIVYFSLFLVLYATKENHYIIKDFSPHTIIYLLILSVLGFASAGQQGYIKITKIILDIFSFYSVALIFKKIEKIENYSHKDVKDLLILLAVIVSILTQSRGIFVVVLIFILPIFAVYYLPPLQLKGTLLGNLIYSAFAGLLFIVSHLSLKTTFSITYEAIMITLSAILFSFLAKTSENTANPSVRRILNTALCFTPLILFRSLPDIIVATGLSIISMLFPKSNLTRFTLILYFTSKYIYLKEKLPKFPF